MRLNNDNAQCVEIKKRKKREKRRLIFARIIFLVLIILLWEILTYAKIIDPFIVSSPIRIIKILIQYMSTGNLFNHILISTLEVLLGIIIGSFMGCFFAFILWYFETFAKIIDPFLGVLNALPKTALAPIIIIWAGTGIKGIVVVALSILLIITIISCYHDFNNVDNEKIKMMKSFGANKIQIFTKLILPINLGNIIHIIKINVGMSWIGVIVGEFLVSRAGIGYLIMYGGQVFDLDLVMMGVFVLAILAYGMWKIVDIFDKEK